MLKKKNRKKWIILIPLLFVAVALFLFFVKSPSDIFNFEENKKLLDQLMPIILGILGVGGVTILQVKFNFIKYEDVKKWIIFNFGELTFEGVSSEKEARKEKPKTSTKKQEPSKFNSDHQYIYELIEKVLEKYNISSDYNELENYKKAINNLHKEEGSIKKARVKYYGVFRPVFDVLEVNDGFKKEEHKFKFKSSLGEIKFDARVNDLTRERLKNEVATIESIICNIFQEDEPN